MMCLCSHRISRRRDILTVKSVQLQNQWKSISLLESTINLWRQDFPNGQSTFIYELVTLSHPPMCRIQGHSRSRDGIYRTIHKEVTDKVKGWDGKLWLAEQVCNHEIKLKPLWKNHTDDDSLVEAHPFWALKPLKKSPPPSPHASNKMHLFNIFVWVSTHQPISNWSFSGELLLHWETQWRKFPILGAFQDQHWDTLKCWRSILVPIWAIMENLEILLRSI